MSEHVGVSSVSGAWSSLPGTPKRPDSAIAAPVPENLRGGGRREAPMTDIPRMGRPVA